MKKNRLHPGSNSDIAGYYPTKPPENETGGFSFAAQKLLYAKMSKSMKE